MRTLTNLFLVFLLTGFISCRDKKKEAAETEAMVQEIESVETEIKQIETEVEQDAKELEVALKELDSI
ncbi:MAG: hypothetical protein KJN82_00615 [Bacteroidia bacterium]|nr:hypothetical protein [Bacteroidia bacterium]